MTHHTTRPVCTVCGITSIVTSCPMQDCPGTHVRTAPGVAAYIVSDEAGEYVGRYIPEAKNLARAIVRENDGWALGIERLDGTVSFEFTP